MNQYETLRPECFNHFTCKGSDCRFTCCNSWGIRMSNDEYNRLIRCNKEWCSHFSSVPVGERSYYEQHEIKLDSDGCCPFLDEQRLCQLQREHGLAIMASVCREYPRVYHRYLHKLEQGMSLGCEKVLELLYEEKSSLTFVNSVESIPRYQRFCSDVNEKNRKKSPVLIYYYDIQSLCLGILQAKDAEMEERLILLGMALFHIDQMVLAGKAKDIPGYINLFLTEIDSLDAFGQLQDISPAHMGVLFSHLNMVHIFSANENHSYNIIADKITEKLRSHLTTEENNSDKPEVTLDFSSDTYRQCQKRFQRFNKENEFFMENMLVAFMFFFNMPFHNSGNGVWKDYTYFIWVYTMVKFSLTVLLEESSTKEDVIAYCAIMFRSFSHSNTLYEGIIKHLEDNQSNSLAHMAIFLKTC